MGNTASANTIAAVAALIGDPARANMLAALMGGMALTSGELAACAGVTPQTASGHLARLADAELLAVARQGRHRYYRLASADVAQAMHGLMTLAAVGPARHHPVGPRDAALRAARTCYDHMAGRLAVEMADAFAARGHVVLADGAGLVTRTGRTFLDGLGVEFGGATRRPVCRTCLDWSERRDHLAGQLGAALLDRFLALGWLARTPGSRALRITGTGADGFAETFGIRRHSLHRHAPPAEACG